MKNEMKLWEDIVKRFAEQSQCRSRKVSAILVKDGRLIAQGWNGAPRSCDESQCIRCNLRDDGREINPGTSLELSICAHAEANCIANAASQGVSTKGSMMICSNEPCSECAKLIIAAEIKEVKYINPYPSEYATQMFENSQINCSSIRG